MQVKGLTRLKGGESTRFTLLSKWSMSYGGSGQTFRNDTVLKSE